jgi:hypothetical protein
MPVIKRSSIELVERLNPSGRQAGGGKNQHAKHHDNASPDPIGDRRQEQAAHQGAEQGGGKHARQRSRQHVPLCDDRRRDEADHLGVKTVQHDGKAAEHDNDDLQATQSALVDPLWYVDNVSGRLVHGSSHEFFS